MYWNNVVFWLLDRLKLNMDYLMWWLLDFIGIFFFKLFLKWEGLNFLFFFFLLWDGFSFCFFGFFSFWIGWIFFWIVLFFVFKFVWIFLLIFLEWCFKERLLVIEVLSFFVFFEYLFVFRLFLFKIRSVGKFKMFVGVVILDFLYYFCEINFLWVFFELDIFY